MPLRRKTSGELLIENAIAGVALGILFIALLAAYGHGPARDLLQRPDAVVAVLCLLVNICALFGTAVAATSLMDRNPDDTRPGDGRRALVPVRVAARPPR